MPKTDTGINHIMKKLFELSNEIPVQVFNLLVNIDIFLSCISFDNYIFILLVQIHTSFEELLNWCHLGIIIKVMSKLPLVITVVTIDKKD